MGAGYNTSLAIGRSTRRKSSTRTAIHFYLDVPVYEYELECGHSFNSRTPMIENAEDHEELLVWCGRCRKYMAPWEPLNQPVSNDEIIAFEQDKGIIRERVALALQTEGYPESEHDLAEAAQKYGIPVREIRQINAGLTATENQTGAPEMCRANLHELTPENLIFRHGRKACRQCDLIAQRNRRARNKIK